jgi:iron complex transport system substrate-binding protein
VSAIAASRAAALVLCVALLEGSPRARAAQAGRQHLGPKVPAKVARVVTAAPSLSEIVLALDAPDLLVGVTRFDDDPRIARLPRIGGYNDPEPEAVLALHPDVVIVQPAPENRGPVEALARLGVPVEAFPLQTVGQIEAALRDIGALIGRAGRADELVSGIERARSGARAAAVRRKRVRALLVFGLEPLVVAGPAGFAGELLEDVGGINAAAGAAQPFVRLSAEAALAAAPEVVVLCGIEPPPGRQPIRGLAARIATLRSTALLHPGPRIPEALGDLAAALVPADQTRTGPRSQ